MKYKSLLIFALWFSALTVNAIPAKPVKTTLFTADGTSIVVTLCGDEHFSFYKDDAGLPYVKNEKGRLDFPSDLAGFFEDFRSRSQRFVRHELALVDGFCLSAFDESNRLDDQLGTLHHEFVVHIFGTIILADWGAILQNDSARIDLLVKEESCDSRLFVAVDNRPIDGSCASILG